LISLCNTFDTAANDESPLPIILGNRKMAIEQMLTILLGTAVGVAVVLYSVKPRQIGASQSFVSGGSSIETFTLPSQSSSFPQNDAAPMPEVTATQSPVVEAPVEEVHSISSGSISTMTAGVAAAGSNDSAIASIDASVVSTPAVTSVAVESPASSAARSHRAPRKSSAPRTQAKPRAAGSTRAPRKRLDAA
jgi:cell division septation protein DedD